MDLFIYFIYLFGVLRRFQHCTGHITMGSWKGRGNQYIQFVRVLYCKLPTNGKQLPAFPHKALTGIEPRPQRWEARVLPLCHCGPPQCMEEYPSGTMPIRTMPIRTFPSANFQGWRFAHQFVLPVFFTLLIFRFNNF